MNTPSLKFYSSAINDCSEIKQIKIIKNEIENRTTLIIDKEFPFDIYLIPRNCGSQWCAYAKEKNLKNAVYILFGTNYIYAGKADNSNRIKDHMNNPEKNKFLYQFLCVPNNNNTESEMYWNNNSTFISVLEGILIEKIRESINNEYIDNRISGLTVDKRSDKISSVDRQEFVQNVSDQIIDVFKTVSNYGYLFENTEKQKNTTEVEVNDNTNNDLNTSDSTTNYRQGNQNHDLYLKKGYIVYLYDRHSKNCKQVRDDKNQKIYATYIGDNKFKGYDGEIGTSSKLAMLYMSKYTNKNIKTINGNRRWKYGDKFLEEYRNDIVNNVEACNIFKLEIQKYFKDANGNNDKKKPYSFIDTINIIPDDNVSHKKLLKSIKILKGSKFHETCTNKCYEGKYEKYGRRRKSNIKKLVNFGMLTKKLTDEGFIYEFEKDVVIKRSLNYICDLVGYNCDSWKKTWKNNQDRYIEEYYD